MACPVLRRDTGGSTPKASAVPGTADDGSLLFQVAPNKYLAVQAIRLPVRVGDFACIDDGEIRHKVLDFFGTRGSDEHIRHEVVLPRDLRYKSKLDTGFGRGSRIAIKYVDRLGVIVVKDYSGMQLEVGSRLHRLVDLAPPDLHRSTQDVDKIYACNGKY
jgi:hypothetical protein